MASALHTPSRPNREALVAAAIFVIGLATIAGAWAFQIFGGYTPCKLCLQQRWPYYIGLPVVFVGLVSAAMGGPRWLTRGALGASAAIFAVGAGLGVYHSGVEWGWWLGPSDCGASTSLPAAPTDFLTQLATTHPVSCTVASWRMVGLSFAGWNAVVSAFLVALALYGLALGRTRRA